jgi:predicted dinucleotide-binding enzyme
MMYSPAGRRDPVIAATMLQEGERTMRITIVGSGCVGRALGGAWMQAGHRVAFAVRDPESANAWLAQALGARLIELEAAGRGTDVVVLAVPWEHVAAVLTAVGPLDGVTVIDTTNPVVPPYARLEMSGDDSGAETIQRRIPSARVVKAMNTCGWETMEQPVYAEGRAVMPVAADDAGAKDRVLGLARDLGFDAVDAGDLAAARLLEPLAMLRIRLATARGMGRGCAFRLMRRFRVGAADGESLPVAVTARAVTRRPALGVDPRDTSESKARRGDERGDADAEYTVRAGLAAE